MIRSLIRCAAILFLFAAHASQAGFYYVREGQLA